MIKNIVKQIKVNDHLTKMIEVDNKLFKKITDNPEFAYHFNKICILAQCGDIH